MDKSWLSKPRASIEYRNGVKSFLDFAFARSVEGGKIVCPCVDCINMLWETRGNVRSHLIVRGFVPKYIQWIYHGEDDVDNSEDDDDIHGLLNDTFATKSGEEFSDKMKEFFTLIQDADQELYSGCKKFSKLSFTIRIYLIKCLNRWSNASMNSLLSLLTEAFPEANISASYSKMKAMIKGLGLKYEKIHAFPNDCMLYYGASDEKLENCRKCGESRYKFTSDSQGEDDEDGTGPKKQVAAKIFRYFPLIPRLQRLFMSSKTAEFMRWHEKKRVKDGKLRHPADGQAWKDFDRLHPEFASECRNVRFSIASDGFNPFRTMTSNHSTWPVIVAIYNLPPWMSMKLEYLILSSIIPGPKSPGNDIDVYLQPFVNELKILWHEGVMTFDAHSKQMFNMHG